MFQQFDVFGRKIDDADAARIIGNEQPASVRSECRRLRRPEHALVHQNFERVLFMVHPIDHARLTIGDEDIARGADGQISERVV